MLKKLFKETIDICDHPQAGQPRSTCMKNVVHVQITQNPYCKQKILSQEMNFALRTVSYVLIESGSLSLQKVH